MEAIATLAAAVGAAIAILYARRAYQLERQRDADREAERRADDRKRRQDEIEMIEHRRREQATRVSAWFEDGEDPSKGQASVRRVVVRNASNLPIRSISVRVYLDDTEVSFAHWSVIPPDSDRFRSFNQSIPPHWFDAPGIECSIRFIDSAGQAWIRGRDGQLVDGFPIG